ncbi:MAG: tyrosine-type recombinase/integrase [Theionarchaea archaeon]|nr:tyrosine-type recombinase/integrase [Theionarchaea archaeon]
MRSEEIRERVEQSYEKYGWTDRQKEVFDKFIEERYANYANPKNTVCSYLDLLNSIVPKIKKPFSDITYDDLVPLLNEWQEKYGKATLHGKRCKLKAFLRWESGNKHDPRAEKIRSGTYVSPVTIHDLLTDDEITELRKAAKDDPRDLAVLDFHLLWGPRPSESVKLKVKDVEINDEYIVVNIPQTKTIYRPVPIPLTTESVIQGPTFLDCALNAYTSLMQYLNAHPGYPDDPDYPLWYDEKKGRKHLDPYSLSRVFRRLGKQAGLEKNISTYMLRRTAFNRFKGVNRELLCAGFGWKPGSKMPTQVYNKLRPQDYLETLINSKSKKVRDIQICPQCGKENPQDKNFCVWCSHALKESLMADTVKRFHADQTAQKELEDLREKMTKMEELLSKMVKVPGFEKFMEEAVSHSE